MGKVNVSLLIPTMNRPETLEATLKSYFSKEFYPAEVIVVDQSADETVRAEVKKRLNGLAIRQIACTSIKKFRL